MGTSTDPTAQPETLLRAHFAPDSKTVQAGSAARVTLVLDNHDRRSRAVQVQLGGPMGRYCRPRISTLDLLPGEQREVAVDLLPRRTAPEGGHAYDLTATITDLTDGSFLDRCAARVAVPRLAAVRTRPTSRLHIAERGSLPLRVVVYNAGNVDLRVNVHPVTHEWWVRRTSPARTRQRLQVVQDNLGSVLSGRVAADTLRPAQHWTVEVRTAPPPYRLGLDVRLWLVPVGIRADGTPPEAVFVEVDQPPGTLVPMRAAVLGVAVLAALSVLAGLMTWLAL